MNQTEKMPENLALGPILAHLAKIWAPNFFFRGFHHYWRLDIIANNHCMQFQEKLKNQTCENGKKPLVLGPILAYLT